MTDLWGAFWSCLTIYRQKRSFRTLSYKKNNFRRIIALYHVGIHWFLSQLPFPLIKAMDLRLFVFGRKDLTLVCICDIRFSQNKIYIKSYTYITKICYFLSCNINWRKNCVVLGKSEDNILLRKQFHSRVC